MIVYILAIVGTMASSVQKPLLSSEIYPTFQDCQDSLRESMNKAITQFGPLGYDISAHCYTLKTSENL